MKELGLQSVPVAKIDKSGRLRPIDRAYATLMAENIRETGRLRQPIEVRKVRGGWKLMAGGHRLEAVEMLGWTEIPAFVFAATEDEARLYEIDENLVRHELNPLDRATFLFERKAIYERLHPETRAGVAGGKARQGAATDIMSFARDTAERVGLTDRTIQRAVLIATKLDASVKSRLAGTWIAQTQAELLTLAKLPPAEQRAVVDLLLADSPQAKTVKAAHRLVIGAPHADEDPADRAFERLYSVWGRASRQAKRAFLLQAQQEGDLADLLAAEELAA
jgi:ParB family chromosome partitioning protein